jgi:ABC-type multidrug transport system fused ATPase/permease subunit
MHAVEYVQAGCTHVEMRNCCRVLCLDEIGAFLDRQDRLNLLTSISHRLDGVTCLWITHDVQTLQRCDVVGVMQAGVLVELGAPSDLLSKQDGLFASLHGGEGQGVLNAEELAVA